MQFLRNGSIELQSFVYHFVGNFMLTKCCQIFSQFHGFPLLTFHFVVVFLFNFLIYLSIWIQNWWQLAIAAWPFRHICHFHQLTGFSWKGRNPGAGVMYCSFPIFNSFSHLSSNLIFLVYYFYLYR